MTPPDFWRSRRTALFWIFCPVLWPLSLIYRLVTFLRWKLTTATRVSIPVFCVGNLTMGGEGKTPTCLALYDLIKALDPKQVPHFISRGYRGSLKDCTWVNIENHTAREVGDEALLLAQKGPCWIGRNRAKAAQAAQKIGATCVILDDGFQNPTLAKDFSIIVLDGAAGIRNGCVFPLGPLRETVASGLSRAHAVVTIGPNKSDLLQRFQELNQNLIVVTASITADTNQNSIFKEKDFIAFAGIGRPQKFYDTLIALGASLKKTMDFPDHHFYTPQDIKILEKLSQDFNAPLVTTEKDYVKLDAAFKDKVMVLRISLVDLEKNDSLMTSIREVLYPLCD
jgi:tetraacyldisaccharide 4'-kinase